MQHNTAEFITMQNKPVKIQHCNTVITQQCTIRCNGNEYLVQHNGRQHNAKKIITLAWNPSECLPRTRWTQNTTQQKGTRCNTNFYGKGESFSASTVQYTARHCNTTQHNTCNIIQHNTAKFITAHSVNTKYNTTVGNKTPYKLLRQLRILQCV